MLFKSELSQLPLISGPSATKKIPYSVGVEVFRLKKSGQILAIDVYDRNRLQFRFFTDGKSFISQLEQTDNVLELHSWTKRNLFRPLMDWYIEIAMAPGVRDKIKSVLGDVPQAETDRRFIANVVSAFISRYFWEKKEKAWEARMALMEKHIGMLPRYPAGLEKFCEGHVFHESVVYLSKLEKGKRRGICRHCGKYFFLDRSVKPGSEGVCPKCGTPVQFRGEWVKGEITHKAKICVAQKVYGQLLLRYVDVIRTITADDVKPDYEFSDYFLNIFPNGTLNGKCYAYYWREWPYYMRGWKRLHNGAECFGAEYVYTDNLNDVLGAHYGNVDLQEGLKSLCRPICFLRLLKNLRFAPQAEYLFKAGLPLLAADSELPGKTTNNFTELLGVSKQYLPILRETQASNMEIAVIAAAGRWVPEDTVRQLCSLNLDWDSLHTLQGLIQYNSLGRILRYLTKQRTVTHSQMRRRKMPYAITMYRDYLHMALDVKSDMKKKAILEPRDLKAQHDLLLARINEQKEEEKEHKLSRPIDQGVYWWAHDYANCDFTVVYPHNRLDFITEGQCLNHCVGNMGYYERHIQGRQMVFFIRKTGQPDKPYFTSEIDVETGHIWQLYGFADCSAPKEVRTFVEGFVKAIGRWRSADAMAS